MRSKTQETSKPSLIPAPPEDLCLTFANTRFWRGSATPHETLLGPADLRDWIAGNTEPDAQTLRALNAIAGDAAGPSILNDALALREALYRVFAAIASQTAIPSTDLAAFNAALAAAPVRTHLAADGGGAAWRVPPLDSTATGLLTPVIWSAADLLAQKHHHRLRRCANDKCLWLFIDRSKAGTRRWCDMKACGNRAKSHRHYARAKLKAAAKS